MTATLTYRVPSFVKTLTHGLMLALLLAVLSAGAVWAHMGTIPSPPGTYTQWVWDLSLDSFGTIPSIAAPAQSYILGSPCKG